MVDVSWKEIREETRVPRSTLQRWVNMGIHFGENVPTLGRPPALGLPIERYFAQWLADKAALAQTVDKNTYVRFSLAK
jgi:hypothetical protein